jgi:hypothetical protein
LPRPTSALKSGKIIKLILGLGGPKKRSNSTHRFHFLLLYQLMQVLRYAIARQPSYISVELKYHAQVELFEVSIEHLISIALRLHCCGCKRQFITRSVFPAAQISCQLHSPPNKGN